MTKIEKKIKELATEVFKLKDNKDIYALIFTGVNKKNYQVGGTIITRQSLKYFPYKEKGI